MRLHPMIVRMHIAETTASACYGRKRRGRGYWRHFLAGALLSILALTYFIARAMA